VQVHVHVCVHEGKEEHVSSQSLRVICTAIF
jgi:hypothetical protein